MSRILIADDDPLILDLVKHKLVSDGHEVLTAEDGEAALATAMSEVPDLVILDGMMPGLDGLEVLRRLKGDPRTAEIKVILLTARSREADIVEALSQGADDYLVKPFMPEELLARAKRVLPK